MILEKWLSGRKQRFAKPRYYLVSIALHKCETELIRIETNGIDVLKVNVMAMRLRRADPPGGGLNRVLAEDEDSSPGGYGFLTKRCDMSGDS